jgi:hypothetical protein
MRYIGSGVAPRGLEVTRSQPAPPYRAFASFAGVTLAFIPLFSSVTATSPSHRSATSPFAADSFARAVTFAMSQPKDVKEILFQRHTRQYRGRDQPGLTGAVTDDEGELQGGRPDQLLQHVSQRNERLAVRCPSRIMTARRGMQVGRFIQTSA